MISSGTSRLIRDLALLLVKYKAKDWEPLVREFRVGSAAHRELSEAIDSVLLKASHRAKRPISAKRAAKGSKQNPIGRSRARILGPLQEGLLNRRVLPRVNALREAARQVGAKLSDSASRATLVDEIIMHLDQMPEERLWPSVQALTEFKPSNRDSLEEDYLRWCAVILGDREDAASRSPQESKRDL